MARTKEQSFVNRYLNQYQQNQKSAVSAGQQAASAAADTGVSTMNQAANNMHVPSLYDYTDDMYGLVLDQQQEQLKAQQAAQNAAQKAAQEQAQSLEQMRKDKEKAQKEELQRRKDAREKEKKNAELLGETYMGGTSSKSYYGPVWEGEVGASAPVMGNIPNENYNENIPVVESDTSDWVWTGHTWKKKSEMTDAELQEQYVNDVYAKLNSGKANEVSYDDALFAYSSVMQNARDIAAQRQQLEKERDDLAAQIDWGKEEVSGFQSATGRQYTQLTTQINALKLQEDTAQEKAGMAMAAVKNAVKDMSDDERAAVYLDPSYTLSNEEKDDARKIIAEMRKYVNETIPLNSGATEEERQLAFDLSNAAELLDTKISKSAAFGTSAILAIPGMEAGLDYVLKQWKGEDYDPETDSIEAQVAPLQRQNPVSSAAGSIFGTMASYMTGTKLAQSVPVLSTGLQKAGEFLGGTKVAQTLAKVPYLGQAFTPAGVTDILGDLLVDTALDTGVGAATSALEGEKSAGEIATDAAKNFGQNLAFDIGSAAVLGGLGKFVSDRRAARAAQQAANAAQDVPVASVSDATRQAAKNVPSPVSGVVTDVVRQADEVPVLQENPIVTRWRNGTLTNADIETLKPGGENRAAFETATGIQLPSTSSETRRMLRAELPSVNAYGEVTMAADANGFPNTVGAKQAEFEYREVPSQSRVVNALDTNNLSQIDIDLQGGPRSYTHQRISHQEYQRRSELIRQTETDNEIISRIANEGSGKMSAEDSVTLGNIIKDMDRQLSAMDDASEEYLLLQRRKLYAQDVYQNGLTEAARTLETGKNFTTPERAVMQAQKTISNTADAIKNAHKKEFGQLENIVKQAVEDAQKSAQQAAENEFKNAYKLVGDASRQLGIDFKTLAKQYSVDKDVALKNLTDKLIEYVGVDGADAAELADRILVAYNQKMQQAVEANLRAKFPELFGAKHTNQKQQAVDNFMQLLNMGVYNNDTVKQLVASKYGIAPLSTEQAGQIQAIMEKAQQFPPKSMERWELQNQAAAIAAENINTSLLDKWNAWRYMSMLGNFRTNEKNTSGNVAQGTLARAKEFVQGAFYEPVADAISKAVKGEGIQRTTAVMNPIFNESDRALLSAGLLDADTSVYSDLVGNSEFFDITKQMGRNRRVFQNEAMERARKGISAALEGADYSGALGTLDFIKEISPKGSKLRDMAESVQEWGKQFPGFSGLRNNYAWSLAEYLKANKVGTEIFEATDEASQKLLANARAWAVRQALENTYHEQAVVADIMNGAIKTLMDAKNPAATAAAMALQGALPFTKTPANVLKQAIRYSPAGFAKAILPNVGAYAKQTAKWVADKNLRAGGMDSLVEFLKLTEKADLSESLDAASKATVGTTLVALGAWLRANGVLTASMSDQEKAAAASTGQQEYAINWESADGTRKSYTIDFLSPISLPMFIGAEFYDSIVENGEGVGNAVASAYTAMLDPLTEMTFLSSVNNILDTYSRVKQSEDNAALALGAAALTAGTSYFTQGIPTIGGQFARAVDDTRRSTYSGSTGFLNALDYQLTQAENRILGLSMTNQPYIDQWGQEEKNTGGNFIGRLAFNMFSPGYYASAEYDPTISALESLDSASAFPKTSPSKTVTYKQNGEDVTHRWTPEEYTQYSQSLGQGSKELADALTANSAFMDLSPEDQLELVSDIYSMANRAAKRDMVPTLDAELLQAVRNDDTDKEQRLDYLYETQGASVVVPYLVADTIISTVKGDPGKDGRSLPGTTEKNMIAALIAQGWTREEAQNAYDMLKG